MKTARTTEIKEHEVNRPFTPSMALRRMLPRLAVNMLLPLLIYNLMLHSGKASVALALVVAALPPLLNTLRTYASQRRFDVIGVLIVAGFALVLTLVLITGDARFVALRTAIMHLFFGSICLVSLALSRPIALTVYKYLRTGGGVAHDTTLERQWRDATVLATSTRVTLVAGVALIALALLQAVLVFFLSTAMFSRVSMIASIGIYVVLLFWAGRSMRSALHQV